MPRRKYWLAFPSPLCCVTIRPGAASSISPGRSIGRVLSVSPEMRFSLAASVGSDSRSRGATTVTVGSAVEAPVPGPNGSGACAVGEEGAAGGRLGRRRAGGAEQGKAEESARMHFV